MNKEEKKLSEESLLRVISLTIICFSTIISLISSPFILSSLNISLLFLIPIVIALGMILSFFGKRQKASIMDYEIQMSVKFFERYLTEDGFKEKMGKREKSKIRKFFTSIFLFILAPIDIVSDLLINISILLFPTK